MYLLFFLNRSFNKESNTDVSTCVPRNVLKVCRYVAQIKKMLSMAILINLRHILFTPLTKTIKIIL